MIRIATESDIPRLVEMGRRFRRESSYRDQLADNVEQMKKLAAQLIEHGGVLVAERDGRIVGMIGFVIHTHFISGETVAGEVFWWTEPEHRGDGMELLREAERRAREAGATRMQMISPTERLGKFYKRLGYEFVEATYQRTL